MLPLLYISIYINLYHTLYCYYYNSGLPSVWIPYSANPTVVANALLTIPYITGVSVTFSQPNGPACNPITNLIFVTFTQQFGDLPPLVPLLDATMISTNGYVNVYADGATGVYDDVHQLTYHSIIGTKESDPCADRGLCLTTGVCQCYNTNGDAYGSSNGYGLAGSRGDCGYIVSGSNVSSCPGDIQCNDNGVCDPTDFRCTCAVQWQSGDCSQRVCPSGPSW